MSAEMEALADLEKPKIKKLYKKLYEVSALISSLTLAGPGKMTFEQYRNKLSELESERNEIEKKWRKRALSMLPKNGRKLQTAIQSQKSFRNEACW